ncbi:MAG: hypothetical protein SF051_09805 [Elusimicrobiota bacterium]|nr:hypothetical protein [Elusimicrobiota bacterium]
MSPTDARRWLLLGAAAFLLRAGTATLTEFAPLFPSYYYQDARFAESLARDLSDTWKTGRAKPLPYSASQRAHAALIAVPYLLVGPRPYPVKLVNAALGALAVVLLGLAFRAVVSERAALAAAALVAAWPSHAFYTSQNFKEAPTFALLFGAWALLLPVLDGERPSPRRLAAALLLLVAAGFLRSYVLAVSCAAFALGAAWALKTRRARPAAALVLLAALAAVPAYHALSAGLFERVIPLPPSVPATLPPLAPIAVSGPVPPPWTPRGLSHRRAQRQASDREYAFYSHNRRIGTQIRPDARFEDWFDVAAFLPSAAFTVLFQPLPGLYPSDGKLGRLLASGENLLLLALAVAAAAGLARRRDWKPASVVPLVFFALMTAGSALMEFDLGSAGRHKLLYLPMLFPFAAEELLRRLRA